MGFVAPIKLDTDRLTTLAAQREVEAATAERQVATHDLEQARAALGGPPEGGGGARGAAAPSHSPGPSGTLPMPWRPGARGRRREQRGWVYGGRGRGRAHAAASKAYYCKGDEEDEDKDDDEDEDDDDDIDAVAAADERLRQIQVAREEAAAARPAKLVSMFRSKRPNLAGCRRV